MRRASLERSKIVNQQFLTLHDLFLKYFSKFYI